MAGARASGFGFGAAVMLAATAILAAACGTTSTSSQGAATRTSRQSASANAVLPPSAFGLPSGVGAGATPHGRKMLAHSPCPYITTTEPGNTSVSCGLAKAGLLAYYKDSSAHLTATDPSNGETYAIDCRWFRFRGIYGPVLCTGDFKGYVFAFTGPEPKGAGAPPPATEAAPSTPPPSVEGPGSTSNATDTRFCSTHSCIANFANGNGYIVQCNDGDWSHSGGLSGACSDHGGKKP
jgi:hypothetical protein